MLAAGAASPWSAILPGGTTPRSPPVFAGLRLRSPLARLRLRGLRLAFRLPSARLRPRGCPPAFRVPSALPCPSGLRLPAALPCPSGVRLPSALRSSLGRSCPPGTRFPLGLVAVGLRWFSARLRRCGLRPAVGSCAALASVWSRLLSGYPLAPHACGVAPGRPVRPGGRSRFGSGPFRPGLPLASGGSVCRAAYYRGVGWLGSLWGSGAGRRRPEISSGVMAM
jgi:hypothetical protein